MSSTSTPQNLTEKAPTGILQMIIRELKMQRGITIPLIAMNFTWFAKLSITTAFLGRLGELSLAGGALGFTFANVTGFSILNGLSGAMEPICGQAFGAKNFRLLHKTLVMAICLLLVISVPIAFLWLNVDKILIGFGQQEDISIVAKTYLTYLLPDLLITSLLCPLKAYLSTQNITIPIILSSAFAVAFHFPLNIILSKAKGLEGVSMAVWISDFVVVLFLSIYVVISEKRKPAIWSEGGWCELGLGDWMKLLKLSGPCCLTACLEWWCYEILVLLTGRLPNAKQTVGVLAIVLNFDYLLFSVMLSLSTCASIRISNELGANHGGYASQAAYVLLGVSIFSGFLGALMMVAVRGVWGRLFSHDRGIIRGVKKMMSIMALLEVVNFPLTACGGIVRGTARPWLGTYANIIGFYFLALPIGILLAFKFNLGLGGLLTGFVVGAVACFLMLLVFISRIGWDKEADKAQLLTNHLAPAADS
ncbi:transporter [Lithospermum erythrorhizon]|uniref:Protein DETOXIFICATION n=1 Tax=Lithospermum erythrorhizon TaxID=34254 RepID=A0AAV3P5G8_LITER